MPDEKLKTLNDFTSKSPIEVFTAEDLRALNAPASLAPLSVSSLPEIVTALPKYHALFRKICKEKIEGGDFIPVRREFIPRRNQKISKSTSSSGCPTQIRTLTGVVLFGIGRDSHDDHWHYFDETGWLRYLAPSDHQGGPFLLDFTPEEVTQEMSTFLNVPRWGEKHDAYRLDLGYWHEFHLLPKETRPDPEDRKKRHKIYESLFLLNRTLGGVVKRIRLAAGLEKQLDLPPYK